MDEPCIVCQENCPVSPKAIYVREEFQVVRDGARTITAVAADSLTLDGAALRPGTLGTGDYFVRLENAARRTPVDRGQFRPGREARRAVDGGAGSRQPDFH